MKNRLLYAMVLSGALVLSACGGNGSEDVNTTDSTTLQTEAQEQTGTQENEDPQAQMDAQQTESRTENQGSETETPTESPEPTEEPVESAEPVVTEREYPAPPEAIIPEGLSDSLESMQFSYNGEIYTLCQTTYNDIREQISVEEFLKRNNVSDYEIGGKRSSGHWSTDYELYYDKQYDEEIRLHNFDTNVLSDKPYAECALIEIKANRYLCTTSEIPSVVAPGGITWGSTREEIIDAYGEPKNTDEYDSLGYSSISYYINKDEYSFICYFHVSPTAGLVSIEMIVDPD